MKALIPLLALVLVATGCATSKQVEHMQGKGTKHVFRAPYDQVWRASVDAAQLGELEVRSADRERGFIASTRGLQPETLGENVGIWVSRLSPTETQVEVVSRQAGPPVFWLKNWEDEILRAIEVNLTRESVAALGAAPLTGGVVSGSESQLARAELDRRLAELRREEQIKQNALLTEQNLRARDELNREIDNVRSELRRLENRLSELELEERRLR